MSDPNSNEFQTLFPEPENRSSEEDFRATGEVRPRRDFPQTRPDTPRDVQTDPQTADGQKTQLGGVDDSPKTVAGDDDSQSQSTEECKVPSLGDAPSPLEQLRLKLVGLQLVNQRQWSEAIHRAEGAEDVHRILAELQQLPSNRDGRGGPIPALTSFQAEQILAGNAERLRLQHYIVLERLGAGGMGEVYKAWNVNLERLEAIKTIIGADEETGTHSSTQGLARFEQEARVLAQLDHDCITTIYHAGREHGVSFIAMEYVSGDNMKEIVDSAFEEDDPVPIWWAVERCIAIASALEHAHQKNVIHRDVKPSNIMITEKGELKVLDMGIARLVRPHGGTGQTSRLTQNQTGLGTPEVMPPEQWADASGVTAASDIYSLGCTLFYLLTGRMPFESTSIQGFMFAHVNDPPPRPSTLRTETPAGLDKVVVKMMAKKPEDRYSNCAELIEALRPFSERDGAPSEGTDGGMFNRSLIAASAGLVLVMAAVAGVIWMAGPQPERPDEPIVTPDPVDPEDTTKADDKKVVEKTTPRVVDRIGDVEAWLEEHRRQNADVWPEADELRRYALGGRDAVTTEDDRQAVVQKTTLETQRRWRNRVENWLDEFQAEHDQVWKTPADLRAFVQLTSSLDGIETKAAFENLQSKIRGATWEKEIENWIANFQADHSKAWPDLASLQRYVDDRFPERFGADPKAAIDQNLFDEIQKAVRNRTQSLIQKQREEWLTQLWQKNKEVWPDLDELRAAAADVGSTVDDDASFDRMTARLEELTETLRNPFAQARPGELGDDVERYQVDSLLHAYQWLLSLPEETKDPDWDFDLRIIADDRQITPGRPVAPDTRLQIEIKPKRSGYPIVLLRPSQKSHFVLRNLNGLLTETESYKADEWTLVAFPTTDAPGIDRVAIYFVDVNPFDFAPEAPPRVKEAERLFRDEGEGMEIFNSRYFLARESGDGTLDDFKSMFGEPLVFERLERHLLEAKPYPTLAPNRDVGHWNVKSFEIHVRR